jgi:hypothetical protein
MLQPENRKRDGQAHSKPKILIHELDRLHAIEPKLKAVEMHEWMATMVDPEDGGLMFCPSKAKTSGVLMPVDMIQQWITSQTQKKKKANRGVATERDEQQNQLVQQHVNRN